MINLSYTKTKEDKDELIDDFSRLEITNGEIETPYIKIKEAKNPEIPIIGVGGAGLRILNSTVKRANKYGVNLKTLGIDTNQEDLSNQKLISNKIHLPDTKTGTAHQYRVGATRYKKDKEMVENSIREYLENVKKNQLHKIVFLILGSGGTGVGAGVEIARFLVNEGYRPVPFFVLPANSEMTRIQFNAAVALYYFSYGPKDESLDLMTILIDNEHFIDFNSNKHHGALLASINERVSATLGDLIVSTMLESHAYSADLNEFIEIFRDNKGIGVMQYLHTDEINENVAEFFENYVKYSTTADVDIYDATRSYLFISAKVDQITALGYRELMLQFKNFDTFSKLHEIDTENEFYSFRGIFTAISLTDRVERLMETAEDARVTVLNKEIEEQDKRRRNPKIDRLQDDEEIDVKTGDELSQESSEEYAELRRKGDLS